MLAVSDKKEIMREYTFSFKDIKRFLVEKFLYDNDTESINILLNIYEVEDYIDNVRPTYISLKTLKKDILRFLKHKEGKELIAHNLSNLICDDINRFELFVYLEGYKAGSKSVKNINELEIMTCKSCNIEYLYNRKKLFNYEIYNRDILRLKEKIFKDIRNDKGIRKYLYDFIFKFNLKLMKRKIYNLNSHLDKQLVFNFDFNEDENNSKFRELNSHLTKRELYGLNKKIVKFLYLDALRVFENAYWDGINDKVIKRYK